jgi:hypothetical protein
MKPQSFLLLLVVSAACIPDRSAPPLASPVEGGAARPAPPAEVLLRVDFEKDPLGAYTQNQLAADWGSVEGRGQGLDEGRATIVATDHGKSLRVLYPRGSVGPSEGGAQFMVKLPRGYDELYCSYRVRFAAGFGFVKGGKLPGLVGGSHPTGGRPADDGFSARMMWRAGGAAVQYLYHPRQTSTYGVDLPYDDARFQPGVWHRVEHRIVMGTPGRGDGVIQGWFDGRLALDKRDALLRLDGAQHADAFYFSTFFGGNDPSWAATRDETVDFDDFVIATGPIK